MTIDDLDDDEPENLALWLAKVAAEDEPADLRCSPAWRFAARREAVNAYGLNHFPMLDM